MCSQTYQYLITFWFFFLQRNIIIAVLVEVVFFAVVVFISLHFFHHTKGRSMIIGILCIVLNIIMYNSTLTVMVCIISIYSNLPIHKKVNHTFNLTDHRVAQAGTLGFCLWLRFFPCCVEGDMDQMTSYMLHFECLGLNM